MSGYAIRKWYSFLRSWSLDAWHVNASVPYVGTATTVVIVEMYACKSMQDWRQALAMYEHQGITFTWLVPPNTWEQLEHFHVRHDDVFLVTYPRSGSHWLMEIIQLLHNDAQPDQIDRSHIDTALEITLCKTPAESKTAAPGYVKAADWKSPRIILTHCFEHLLPQQVWEKKPKMALMASRTVLVCVKSDVQECLVIYLMRNPKDVAVSAYHFINQLLPPFLKEWDDFINYFLSDQYFGGPWFKHVLGYLSHQSDDNFLFVKYEDLHKDMIGEIKRINDHLGRPLSTDKLDQTVELSTFQGMQKSYADADNRREGKDEGAKPSKLFGSISYLRKGSIGQWRTHFGREINEKFDSVYKQKMDGSGLHLEFE